MADVHDSLTQAVTLAHLLTVDHTMISALEQLAEWL
jgi:hypothetical protein